MKVVFIGGPPGSGKDTLANHLVNMWFVGQEHPSHKFKFAEALKVATHALYLGYGSLKQDLEKTNYVQVYGPDWFNDCMDTPIEEFFGKTPRETYSMIHEKFGYIRFSSRQIPVFTHAIFGLYSNSIKPIPTTNHYVGVLKDDFFEQSKNVRSHLFDEQSPREAYIYVSEENIKPLFKDNHFFGKVLVNRLKQVPEQNTMVFISDSGFYDEATPVIDYCKPENCFQFRIHAEKRGKTFIGDSRSYFVLPITNQDIENNISDQSYEFCENATSILGSWLVGDIK